MPSCGRDEYPQANPMSATQGPPKTYPSRPSTPPGASAQDGNQASRLRYEASPASPALSTSSTVDGSDDRQSSPLAVPSLPAPQLPARARRHLRRAVSPQLDPDGPYVTTSWGSPYSQAEGRHLRQESSSSETSEDSPIHRLAISTPFLRTVPQPAPILQERRNSALLSESAAVLVNRVRRPVLGITEDWIRAHTTRDLTSENRHWLSDGDNSEHSSLSGSLSSDEEAGWFEEADPQTPRARVSFVPSHSRQISRAHPRKVSSNETLRQATLNRRANATMENTSADAGRAAQDGAIDSIPGSANTLEAPRFVTNGSTRDALLPTTPAKPTKLGQTSTPRLRKKVPWKGKSIVVHVPRDESRWQTRNSKPLSPAHIESMLRSWEELGYNTRGFDLDAPRGALDPLESTSQSCNQWPNPEDMVRDRSDNKYKVTLPDLNAWRDYVNELNEAKLRALGVSFGDDEPAPSISPVPSGMSRQTSNQYPPLPFSPPLPTGSATSAGPQGFPFPGGFHGASGTQSPSMPSGPSPIPFHAHGKYNPRASISVSPNEHAFNNFHGQPSPRGWSPQVLLQQQMGRNRSPSMLTLGSLLSPSSPFPNEGMPASPLALHQRHQSLQFPMLPHQHLQRQESARASPLLHELREVDEDVQSNPFEETGPSQSPKPGPFIKHNASASLQKEIDDAEYHLEEQFREQLEHEDYSPHNENQKTEAGNGGESAAQPPLHARGPSVHFGNFGNDPDEGPVLHHPRPHSRGHSLTQQPYVDNDDIRGSYDEASVKKPQAFDLQKVDERYEIETNPSNMGTPVQTFELVNKLHHQPTFSTASNPWADAQSMNEDRSGSRRPSHSSKSSLSKLNAGAAEFKFNPTSNFTPGQFNFGAPSFQPGATSFQPMGFQASTSNPPQSASSSHFSHPSNASSKARLMAAAATAAFSPKSAFSPQSNDFSFPAKSDFNFSASGPKFNPDAPAFRPFGSAAPSITSATASGYESSSNLHNSIFGNIDMNVSNAAMSSKKSKAVPIVKPASPPRPAPEPASEVEYEDEDGRLTDKYRKKKFRDQDDNGEDVPQFAEPTPEPETAPTAHKGGVPRDEDGEAVATGDTSLASTLVSESNDGKLQSESNGTKATTSPSATSPDHEKPSWNPFEFSKPSEAQDFNNARPFGEFEQDTNKTDDERPSAAAKPFVPGDFLFGGPNPMAATFEPALKVQPPPMVEPELSEDDRAASPTPMPEPRPADADDKREWSPEPVPRARVGLGASRFASSPVDQNLGLDDFRFASPPRKTAGLAASRFATEPSPVSDGRPSQDRETYGAGAHAHGNVPLSVSPPSDAEDQPADDDPNRELTFEEIDAVMQQINRVDPTQGVRKTYSRQPSTERDMSRIASPALQPDHHFRDTAHSTERDRSRITSPALLPDYHFRDTAPSPSPRHSRVVPGDGSTPVPSTELEDPFVDPPHSAVTQSFVDGPVYRLNGGDTPQSDWEADFSPSEQDKLERRARFFNGHVDDVVGNALADRLYPLEQALGSIQDALGVMARRPQSGRRGRRSVSNDLQESDADDEDDEPPVARRSLSPRKDKRMEQVRYAVFEALKQHQALQPAAEHPQQPAATDSSALLQAIEEMKAQLQQSQQRDSHVDELRALVEEAVQNRRPATPSVVHGDEEASHRMSEMQSRIHALEQRLRAEEGKLEQESALRRSAEEQAVDLRRQLGNAETKVEVEIMNRCVYDQRVHDLEDRLKTQENRNEVEVGHRREAEDRLSEIQRLLRISSEEEDRLRAVLEEKEAKIKSVEHAAGKSSMRLALLEVAQANTNKNQAELTNRLNTTEEELRTSRQEARHWQSEAEHARNSARQKADDLVSAVAETKHLRKLIDTLGTQLEENERMRDTWRAKCVSMQDDMAHAAREMTEENSRRIKKEQVLLARQEVLDARVQAESRTRERLEAEIERLEGVERAGFRAQAEAKRLEGLLMESRNENHKVHQSAMRLHREAQEARQSAAAEVQRAQTAAQSELDSANEQVNAVRAELEGELAQMRAALEQTRRGADSDNAENEHFIEEETSKLRAELDQVKLDADTAKAHHEMMLEAATNSKATELEALSRKHQNEVEDLQARYERQLNNTTEDAQRAEQNLLERLSLATSKTEHLQDRVAHLEDKLQIAQEAARAAAQAAKAAGASDSAAQATMAGKPAVSQAMQLPERISPQALRESIMVLQEQLQAREQRIEELEQTVSKLDPEAATKITKRDDEITWLRELLAVRHGDLQDIIGALSADKYDREAVKDAAIRLKANLQMEEQERERAMNGGSAINLPNIAATIQAATPRVAQAVGPLAAAWGNWRKANQQPSQNRTRNLRSSPAPARNATPSKTTVASPGSQSGFLSGLMTPPASGPRDTPPMDASKSQPTAFGNTGRRFTAEQFAERSQGPSMSSRQAEKMPAQMTPPPRVSETREPMTPPMMRPTVYDDDAAQVEDFDDAVFFDD